MRRLVSIVERKTCARERSVPDWNTSEVVSRALQRGLLCRLGVGFRPGFRSDLKYLQISSKVKAKQLCQDDVAAGTTVQSGEQDHVRDQRSLWEGR